jgi:hypothetical protein
MESIEQNAINIEVMRMDLYLVERYRGMQRISTAIHCGVGARTDYSSSLQTPAVGSQLSVDWYTLDQDDRLLDVCP